MFEPDENGVLARVTVSPMRRLFLLFALYALGLLFLGMAYSSPAGFGAQLFLVICGAGVLAYAEWNRRGGAGELVLHVDGLFDGDGTLIAATDQFVKVDRGVFAFKPSNGFSIVLKDPQPRGWTPGLWWRFGRRVGVGGIASAAATKFMAEQIALRLEVHGNDSGSAT